MSVSKTFFIAISFTAALAGCGGGGGGAGGSASPGNNNVTSSVNIQTYFRDPNIAFNTTVNSTNSTSVPGVSLPTDGSTDFVTLNINVQSYQPTWYPITASDRLSNIQVGLYPIQNINSKANFIKGIIPHDAGGVLNDVYRAGYFPGTWDRIKYVVNGNTVVYADSAIMHQFDLINNSITMGGDYFPPNSTVMDMGNMAKSRNLNFMMMVGFYPGDANVNSFYSNIWNIPASNTQFWDSFFAAYKTVLIDRATLAAATGATHLAIGFELDFAVNKGNDRWIDLIRAVRNTGYTGKISYFAGTNYDSNTFSGMTLAEKNSFIQLFDEIGMSVNAAILPAAASDLQRTEESINEMKNFFTYQINSFKTANVPIIVMIATASTHGNVISSAYVEPGLPCAGGNILDYQQQADVYEAAAEVINSTNGVGGLLSWGYAYRNNMTTQNNPNDVCYKYSASIRGKQAEAVLKYWFGGW